MSTITDSIYFKSLTFLFMITISSSFFLPKLTTRFCYNSNDPARVNSQCVYCNYYLFDSVSALTINITATQAFCVISQCLGQIRQAPVFLGRRRKRELDSNFIETSELTDNEKEDYNLKKEDDKQKNHNLPLNNLNYEQLEVKNTLNDQINSNHNKLNEEELKRKDALIQQEAIDSLNLSAYKSQLATDEHEDEEILETTTEIIEFNLNGEQNKYIVKKEVQAVIVDIPDLFDVTYPIAS